MALEVITKPSFFDALNEPSLNKTSQMSSNNLWLTLFNKGTILFSGIMCKQDKDNEVNEYFFQLYDKFLVKCTAGLKNRRILAILPLLFVRLEYQDQSESKESQDELPFFLLTKNNQYDILVPDTLKNFNTWLQFFRSRCIMSFYGEYYTNKKIIGKGSFAKVMLCVRNEDKKEFAVKVYDKKKIMNSKNGKLTQLGIQNEIKILQSLNHKNIIKLHETYEGEYHIYLVLELLTGGELFNKLQTKENYSEHDAYELMLNLLSAVDYIHQQGIMHRDIKPENLIIRSEGGDTEIVLVDFGLSEKYCGSVEGLLFKRCGTPGYVAPEILNQKEYDMQADVFSIGIIFYIILTGYAPFFGDTYNEILEKNKKGDICFDFYKIGLNLSSDVIDLLKKMLNPNPSERITIKESLNHPWMKQFSPSSQTQNKTASNLQFKKNTTNILKDVIKQTKPNQNKDLVMISPVVNGNIEEIKSPFNKGSPEELMYTPIENRKKDNFSTVYSKAISQKEEKQQKIQYKERSGK